MSFIIGWKVNCEVFPHYDVISFFICHKTVSDTIVEYAEFNGIISAEIHSQGITVISYDRILERYFTFYTFVNGSTFGAP